MHYFEMKKKLKTNFPTGHILGSSSGGKGKHPLPTPLPSVPLVHRLSHRRRSAPTASPHTLFFDKSNTAAKLSEKWQIMPDRQTQILTARRLSKLPNLTSACYLFHM